MKPLDASQQTWVDQTLASLSLPELVAQLLIPKIDNEDSVPALLQLMRDIPFGGLFVWGAPAAEHRRRIEALQKASRIPIVVAADLEAGGGYVVHGTAAFPDPLAVAAAGREDLAYAMGQAAAVEGRAAGIHWAFAPLVDVNINPDNPIANSRCFGDDPELVSRLSCAVIRGMQDHGLAACAKHFPGDGLDDVDQHISTSINPLRLEDWKRISGRAFNDAFAADALTTMIGHIAFPAWDSARDARGCYTPATLSSRIVTDLLRSEMGFEGLVVTDDMNMGGAAGYANRHDRTIGCIRAGCDMLLFPALPQDYETLLAAVKSGAIPEARIRNAARHVLEFKARLGFHRGEVFGPEPSANDRAAFSKAAQDVAESSICCVRDTNHLLPLRQLRKGAQVLTVTLTNDHHELVEVDRELERRGFHVRHIVADNYGAVDKHRDGAEAIFINFTFKANWGVGSPRSVGPFNRAFMNGFHMEHPCVVFTSFGSPYHLRQFTSLPNLVNVHSSSVLSQLAAVRAWFGEIPMTAKSPVGKLERKWSDGILA